MAVRNYGDLNYGDAFWGYQTGQPYTDFTIVCGLSQSGVTNGQPDALQFGIPVRGNELWEFSFWMCHQTGDPDAQVIGTWITFDTNGVSKGAYVDDTSYAPNGYLLDATAWTHYRMQHVIATKSDGLTTDPSGGVCGYILPCIWWHAPSKLNARYVMGVLLTKIQGVGGAIAPLAPDVYLTLGVIPTPPEDHDLLASTKSILGPGT
jgi:hypothetical protein